MAGTSRPTSSASSRSAACSALSPASRRPPGSAHCPPCARRRGARRVSTKQGLPSSPGTSASATAAARSAGPRMALALEAGEIGADPLAQRVDRGGSGRRAPRAGYRGPGGGCRAAPPDSRLPCWTNVKRGRIALPENGVEIATLDFGGRGPLALLHHANGFCAAVWAPVAKALTRHYRVIAMDARGHGRLVQAGGRRALSLGLVRPRRDRRRGGAAAGSTARRASRSGSGHSFGGTALLTASADAARALRAPRAGRSDRAAAARGRARRHARSAGQPDRGRRAPAQRRLAEPRGGAREVVRQGAVRELGPARLRALSGGGAARPARWTGGARVSARDRGDDLRRRARVST